MATINWKSVPFWSAVAGAASLLCGVLGAGNLAEPLSAVLTAIGGLIIAVSSHGAIQVQVAKAKLGGKF